ncbi:MAG: TatD family hydrolase [Rhizobiales bacterium]|nr:TatD family hydrolase [Hyphomicrobiales bacterium]NRB14930.1 TatD family hydrolase [Hyphomicrobiales bacterium]
MLVDSHCHLDFPDFEHELPQVIQRAHDAGVGIMTSISTRIKQFDKIHNIALEHEHIYCTVGTHPCNAQDETDISVEQIIEYTSNPKVIGIGEAGLDYFHDQSFKAEQDLVFRNHIEAARQTGLPLIIHSRNSDDAMAAILNEEMQRGEFKLLLHCFSSGIELCKTGLDLGAFVSFSGIVSFKNAANVHEAAKLVPIERILVETDAPYLAPTPHRGKRNEPAFVTHTAEALANVKQIDIKKVHNATTQAFFDLFSKVPSEKYAGWEV